MHSGTEPDGRSRHDPPATSGPRRRTVAGGPGRGGNVPPPDPLTDTAPTGGLHKFDLGMVPASVTPPRTWRHAAWFVITSSAAALGGIVLAGSLLVSSPVRLDGLDLPSMPRGDYPSPQSPQPQPQRTTAPQPHHPLNTPPSTTVVGETRPLAGPSTAQPVRETQPAPSPQPSAPPEEAAPPEPPADTPTEPPAPPDEPELPDFDDIPEQLRDLPTFPPDTSPPLFNTPTPELSPDEEHQMLFSGELPTDMPGQPSSSTGPSAVPTDETETDETETDETETGETETAEADDAGRPLAPEGPVDENRTEG